jgi:superfamily II DNA or RNA helicase
MSESISPTGWDGGVRLRPYQVEAIERVRECVRAGVRRIVIVLPTGGGKTLVASHIIASAVARGSRVVFLAHRRELVNQAYRKLIAQGLAEDQVGVLMASDPRRRPAAPVQVASVDTLRNRAKPPAELVFVDEAHRARAKSYKNIAAEYPKAVHLGLTATPYRADGEGLADAYDDLVVVASTRQLIVEGYLVEPRVFTVPDSAMPDLSGVRVKGGDYDEAALADVVDRQPLVGNIVEHWLKHASGLRTVVFAVSVAHSRHIVERFQQAGVAAEHLDGTTPLADRDAILGRLEAGTTQVVANCGVLCEGWDQPSAKCAVLARPTKSTGLYLQQAGRILRPWQGARAIILDHGGCALEHGLPQDDREFCLEGTRKKRGKRDTVAQLSKVCPACIAVLPPATRVCPECGYVFLEEKLPQESDGNLVEVTAQAAPPPRPLSVPAIQSILRDSLRGGGKLSWDQFTLPERRAVP